MVLLAEPWIDFNRVPATYWRCLGLRPFMFNDRGYRLSNLWRLCTDSVCPTFISSSAQQCSFSVLWEQQHVYISTIYVSTSYLVRRDLWQELSSLYQNFSGPWIAIGDFNAVLGSHEKRGGGLPSKLSCDDFNDWSNYNSLSHIPTKGVQFTWSNGRLGSSYTNDLIELWLMKLIFHLDVTFHAAA